MFDELGVFIRQQRREMQLAPARLAAPKPGAGRITSVEDQDP